MLQEGPANFVVAAQASAVQRGAAHKILRVSHCETQASQQRPAGLRPAASGGAVQRSVTHEVLRIGLREVVPFQQSAADRCQAGARGAMQRRPARLVPGVHLCGVRVAQHIQGCGLVARIDGLEEGPRRQGLLWVASRLPHRPAATGAGHGPARAPSWQGCRHAAGCRRRVRARHRGAPRARHGHGCRLSAPWPPCRRFLQGQAAADGRVPRRPRRRPPWAVGPAVHAGRRRVVALPPPARRVLAFTLRWRAEQPQRARGPPLVVRAPRASRLLAIPRTLPWRGVLVIPLVRGREARARGRGRGDERQPSCRRACPPLLHLRRGLWHHLRWQELRHNQLAGRTARGDRRQGGPGGRNTGCPSGPRRLVLHWRFA
mmetsp:Transcript_110219/g.355789  ORF Transcript_110219/g.355789 Transcript_110219/m.355789 type:complete len:374 (+) Transcript_110219:268-1389(+)